MPPKDGFSARTLPCSEQMLARTENEVSMAPSGPEPVDMESVDILGVPVSAVDMP